MTKKFFYADDDDILNGKVADVYFHRGEKVLKEIGINPHVYGEVTASSIPQSSFGIFAGLEETLRLLEGKPVTVRALPEGSIFYAGDPVLSIEGKYADFGVYETAFLGFLCFSSGVATKAAKIKRLVLDKPVFSFGARRMHPSVAPAVERAAYIGGCDGVATVSAAQVLGIKPVGTMSHAFIISVGSPEDAYRYFDLYVEPDVSRVALIDTFEDEKFGAITAAQTLKEKLNAVRLDTPGSRRGNFRKIIEEVRWELDLRGFKHVKIFVSGGLDEESVKELRDIVDAFGVGTSIANARVVDFAFDIVEREGKPSAKRGKKSGKKQLYECPECLEHTVLPLNDEAPTCKKCSLKMKPMLETLIKGGKRVAPEENPGEIRNRTLSYLKKLNELEPL